MVTIRPPKTIVKPTALGPVANTDTKLLIYGLFQKGRVLAQDGVGWSLRISRTPLGFELAGSVRIFGHDAIWLKPAQPYSAGFNQPLSAPNH